MKVAVSIPDDVFARAEGMARRLGTSRSRLYACALDAYTARPSPEEITEAANLLADQLDESNMREIEAITAAGARTALANTEW